MIASLTWFSLLCWPRVREWPSRLPRVAPSEWPCAALLLSLAYCGCCCSRSWLLVECWWEPDSRTRLWRSRELLSALRLCDPVKWLDICWMCWNTVSLLMLVCCFLGYDLSAGLILDFLSFDEFSAGRFSQKILLLSVYFWLVWSF